MSIVSTLTNTQYEKIEICKVDTGKFKGSHLLVIHDDIDQSDVKAIHLLDDKTVEWLLKELPKL